MYHIGFDIGGTKIHGVLLKNGRVVERVRMVHEKKTREAVLEVMHRTVDFFQRVAGSKIMGIGVGVPSTLDAQKRTVLAAPNFYALHHWRLADALGRATGIPVRMENDARCFAVGAAMPSAVARKRKGIVVGITLGTGLGGGILVRGKIWNGAKNGAAEFGHMVIEPKGILCSCGRRGCLEAYASAKMLVREGAMSPQELQRRAEQGDERARKVYKKFGEYLGLGIANIMRCIDPDVVVLGGGIAHAHKLFMRTMKKTIELRVSSLSRKTPVVIAKNINDAGAIGATKLFY